MINQQLYSFFSRRAGINTAVRHISTVNKILDSCGRKTNLVDLISITMQETELNELQIKSIISTILCDKWNYHTYSINLNANVKDPSLVVKTISTWTGVDVVFTYESPELGFIAINPKNPASSNIFSLFRKNELFTIYAGYQGRGRLSYDIFLSMLDAIDKIFRGEEVVTLNAIMEGKYVYKDMPLPTTFSKKKKIQADETIVCFTTTPYQMTKVFLIKLENSNFNNMHFRSWQRIIKDYTDKYKTANVYIFYKDEIITNMEELVQHDVIKQGSVLEVSIKDFDIQEASRLFKYLQEALTERCEIFTSDSADIRENLF